VDDAVADLAAHEFGGAVGDDLVRVHIRRGPGAGLEDIDRELVVVFASDDLVGGLDDRLGDVVVDQAEVAVGLCGGLLDDAEPADESATERDPRDREVPDGALGLGTPVGVRGYLHLAEAVLLDSVVVSVCHTRRVGVGQVKSTESPISFSRARSRKAVWSRSRPVP